MNVGKGVLAKARKRHFKTIDIGSRLLLKPNWSQRRPLPGQKVVVLDPGLSFGTGQHPTSAFCLRELVARRSETKPQSFLDIGSGSGILAIAAAKIGYSPVLALDFDPEAVRIAQANARRNRLNVGGIGRDRKGPKIMGLSNGQNQFQKRICFQQQDVRDLPLRSATKYSVICANLTSDLLLAERDRIVTRLQDRGILVLAGILITEFGRVRHAFEIAGLRLITSSTTREWRSGTFARRDRSTGFSRPKHPNSLPLLHLPKPTRYRVRPAKAGTPNSPSYRSRRT